MIFIIAKQRILFIFIVFILGLCVGSFLNVLIYRLPRGLGFVKGRSFCPKCKRKINWFDNVPLISFILLKGRCRFCRSPISLRYPVVELTTGLLTLLIFNFQFSNNFQFSIFNFQTIFNLILGLILTWSLVIIFFIDLEHQIIPDRILLLVILLYSLYSVFSIQYSVFAVAFFSSLFFFLLYLITKGKGMGLGDVKLAFLMGLVLGYPKIIVAFYLAFLTGALVGVILILGKKAKFGQKIAFGPFLCLATTVTYLWGENFLEIIKKFLFLY